MSSKMAKNVNGLKSAKKIRGANSRKKCDSSMRFVHFSRMFLCLLGWNCVDAANLIDLCTVEVS